jgi:hypothetical protein
MQPRRTSSLYSGKTPAVTAENIQITVRQRPAAQDPGTFTHAEACSQIIDLRRILAAERKRHSLSEKVLTKYTEILEKQITDLTEAFAGLGRPLIPSPLGRAARRH